MLWTSCSALKFIHFPGLASFGPHVMYICMCACVSVFVNVYMCVVCSVCLGEFLEQLGTILIVDLVDLVSKNELPNTFRRCVLRQDARSAQSQQQLEPCMFVCAYVCVRIYEDARIPVSFAAQAPRTKDRATGVNETSLLHAPLRLSKWNQSGIFKASLIRLPPPTKRITPSP